MSSNTRLTRYEYICLHISIMMYAAVLVSNLSSVNSSTTTTTTTTTAPSSTLTTENVMGATSTESGTTTETTTLQGISTEETTTQPDDTSQSTTDSNKITTNDYTTQSPETTTDMSTQSTINAVTSETTSTSATTQNNTLITISTTTSTEEPETTTTSDTITQETSSISVENSISTEAPITMTTTTQDPNVTSRSASDTTISASSESTEAPKDNQTTITTQRSSDTTSSVSNTTTSTSVETPITYSTEGTNLTTTTQEPNSTNTVAETTTEATNQTTTSPSVENTTITQPSTAAITTTQPTTTATRTTTARTTTTKKSYQITPVYPSIENAVLEFSFELKFTDCTYNKTLIESKLSVVSGSVEGCKYIRVKSINSGPCPTGRRKRSASTPRVSADTVFGVDAQMGIFSGSNVSNNLYTTLYTVENIDGGYLNETKDNFTAALTSKQICDSDVCTSALVGRPGFVCVAELSGNNTQRCALMYYCDHQPIDCGKYGHCYVETEIQSERVFYTSKCRCTNEEFFRYEGSRCTERVITWELAVIICASASGALILLLLFIVIVMCCRNASNSADVSFEESELMYTPSGIASANGRNGRDASKGVENQGYMEVRDTSASWKPEASANTYAHIESKLREHNYDIQIKRPQVTQFRKSDEVTEF